MSWKIDSDIENALLHVRISTSNILLNKQRHNNRVSLHRPYLGSMFRKNIKGAPSFTLSS
ncbi:hypothetical protein MTR_1g069130 [Medicago truncatula]|uniref:Uncharacterized protein n=1 Tax=Medicago truncatula TaxID=3880 RepID=A0A072VKV3_MEDTR|nr:hypothetical protein MTR_1g069130 [Medicago truncatula]